MLHVPMQIRFIRFTLIRFESVFYFSALFGAGFGFFYTKIFDLGLGKYLLPKNAVEFFMSHSVVCFEYLKQT